MIEHVISKIFDDTKATTGLTKLYLGYFIEAKVKEHGYPFGLVYNNNWRDQNNKDAVVPGEKYMIEGNIILRFYGKSLAEITNKYPFWRNAFITETKKISYSIDTVDLKLQTMKMQNNTFSSDRIADFKRWYAELVAEYTLTYEYTT